jgi:thioesterase domain-containing protein/acyl carrier protein
MIPGSWIFLDALPQTPNGKIDRRGLPAPGSTLAPANETSAMALSKLEHQLIEIWKKILKLRSISVEDNFFDLGGHSLLALQLIREIEAVFNKTIPLNAIFLAPSPRQLADLLSQKGWASPWFSLIPLNTSGSRRPLFLIHGGFSELVRHLESEHPIYVLNYGLATATAGNLPSLPERVEDIAQQYIDEMRLIQPKGPYQLIGHSGGGLVAYEMARQLIAQGQEVGLLALLDTYILSSEKMINPPILPLHRQFLRLLRLPGKELWLKLEHRLKKLKMKTVGDASTARMYQGLQLWQTYRPKPYPGKVFFFKAMHPPSIRYDYPSPELEWMALVHGELIVHEIQGHHSNMLKEPWARILAEKLLTCLK